MDYTPDQVKDALCLAVLLFWPAWMCVVVFGVCAFELRDEMRNN